MEALRSLDELAKVKEQSNDSPPPISPLMYSDGPESSSAFVGCSPLFHDNYYVICMRDALYVFDGSKVVQKHPLDPSQCVYKGYWYLKNYSQARCPAHIVIKSDLTLLVYSLEHDSLKTIKSLQLPIDFRAIHCLGPLVPTAEGIYYSTDEQSIQLFTFDKPFSCDSLGGKEVYKTSLGKMLCFEIMNEGRNLICLYRHTSTGLLFVELAKRQSKQYTLSGRYRLQSRTRHVIKKVSDKWIVCVTPEATWSFKADHPPICLENSNASELQRLACLTIRRTRNRTTLRTFCDPGIVLEAVVPDVNKGHLPTKLKWRRLKQSKSPSFSPNELQFVTEVYDNHYLVVSRSKGVSLLSLERGALTRLLTFNLKWLLDGSCIPNGGSDLDSVLLCGALTEKHGFIEKRFLRYPNDLLRLTSKTKLHYSPVEELWDTEGGIVYRCGESLYRLHTGERLDSWNTDVLLKKITEITKREGGLSSLKYLSNLNTGNFCHYSAISKGGILRIIGFEDQENIQILLQINLGSNTIDSAQAAVTYHKDEKSYGIACYHQYGFMSLYRDEYHIQKYTLGFDFFVTNLMVKDSEVGSHVIVTSSDSRAIVYASSSTELLMEVRGVSNLPFKIFDVGRGLPFVFLYNERESIMINMITLEYGRLRTKIRPNIFFRRNRAVDGVLYALEYPSTLNTFQFSSELLRLEPELDSYQFRGSLPLCLALFPRMNYAVVVTRTSSRQALQVKLFDYNSMQVVDHYESNQEISNAFIVSLSNSQYSDIFIGKFFLLCCNTGERAFFRILRIDRAKIVPIQHEILDSRIASIVVAERRPEVYFVGSGVKVYSIVRKYSNESVSLERTTLFADKSLQVAVIDGLDSAKAVSPFGMLDEIHETEKQKSNIDDTMNGYADMIKKVAVRRLDRLLPAREVSAVNLLPERQTSEILQRFVKPWKKNKERLYVMILESSHRLTISYQSSENTELKPICRFHVEDPIVTIAATNGKFTSVQTACSRLQNALPLFMILCSNGTVHTIMEPKEKPNNLVKGRITSLGRLA